MGHSQLCRRGYGFRDTTLTLSVVAIVVGMTACASELPVRSSHTDEASFLRPTATIEDIMRWMVDPAADGVWDAVVTVGTVDGIKTTQPETDDDWRALRRHAITLVEATNLLLIDGRRVAGSESHSELPGIDLEPEEIELLVADDRETWTRLVHELHDAGVGVLDAVEATDVDELLVAGDQLDLACENCHSVYWYPGYGGRPDDVP